VPRGSHDPKEVVPLEAPVVDTGVPQIMEGSPLALSSYDRKKEMGFLNEHDKIQHPVERFPQSLVDKS
jgi:hypothetical protein